MIGFSHFLIVIMMIALILLPLALIIVEKSVVEYEILDAYQVCDFAVQTVISNLSIGNLSKKEVLIESDALHHHVQMYLNEHLRIELESFEVTFYGDDLLPMVASGQIFEEPFIRLKATVLVNCSTIDRLLGYDGKRKLHIFIAKEVSVLK